MILKPEDSLEIELLSSMDCLSLSSQFQEDRCSRLGQKVILLIWFLLLDCLPFWQKTINEKCYERDWYYNFISF